MLGALVFAIIAALGVLYAFGAERKPLAKKALRPSWHSSDLPLLILIDERGPRAEMIVKESMDAWNDAIGSRFFAFGGYEPNIEAYARPTPGIITIRFLAGFTERPHTQLLINQDLRVRASPILVPTDSPDSLLVQIVTHELGHALGLGHNSDPTSVMFERPLETARRVTLSDLRALHSLYEMPK